MALLLSTLFYTASATADRPVPPRGVDSTVNGVAMRCYDLEEYKVIANDYLDYGFALDEVQALDEKVKLLDTKAEAWKAAADQALAQQSLLSLSLQTERDARWRENESSRRQRWFALGGLVLSVVVIGTMGTVEAVK